jgi:DNA processing protein
LESYGGRMVFYGDDDYPSWLSTINDAPPVLSIMGSVALLSRPCVAIVGTRNASANAKRYTDHLARDLGQKGQVIVSGLARGIDTSTHIASLDSGTIAVVAGGIDQIYPKENSDLYRDICEKGCVVSEMPFGTTPTAHHFPRRNRIVSGLSKGVIVIEASMRSGSLITARLAGEQGREVFAIPGFPGDPRAAGPNHLIQNGAKLVQNADDVLDELIAMNNKMIQPTFETISEGNQDISKDESEPLSDDLYQVVLSNLSFTPMDIDSLVRETSIAIHHINIILLDLELMGSIERHAGNKVSKIMI